MSEETLGTLEEMFARAWGRAMDQRVWGDWNGAYWSGGSDGAGGTVIERWPSGRMVYYPGKVETPAVQVEMPDTSAFYPDRGLLA